MGIQQVTHRHHQQEIPPDSEWAYALPVWQLKG